VLKVRVQAAPHEGEANAALIRFLAKMLRVAPRDIQLAGGATTRLKRLWIAGPADALSSRLEAICAIDP
jgi:uncharacterized protein YggU (UPF0235/DUF167 family)